MSALFGARARARVGDMVATLGGLGMSLTGSQVEGTAGTGLVLAGVGLPTVWLAVGARRTRRKLDEEQTLRRRSAGMAAAQDSRIQALRQRLRGIDAAQTQGRGELAIAQSGLLTTRVELAAMRANLAATRHDLGAARLDLVTMREQLATMLDARLEAANAGPQLVVAGSSADGSADASARLILPPGLVMPGRVDAFAGADREVFAAFAAADHADHADLVPLLAVSPMVAHDEREYEDGFEGSEELDEREVSAA